MTDDTKYYISAVLSVVSLFVAVRAIGVLQGAVLAGQSVVPGAVQLGLSVVVGVSAGICMTYFRTRRKHDAYSQTRADAEMLSLLGREAQEQKSNKQKKEKI